MDGLIVSNTTVSRPSHLKSANSGEGGGLSGSPLTALATDTVRDIYRLTDGKARTGGYGLGVSIGVGLGVVFGQGGRGGGRVQRENAALLGCVL